MYAQLGNIIFQGLFGPDRYSWKGSSNLAQHPIIEGKPRLQKVGENLDELTIELYMHSRFCNPEAQLSALIESKNAGEIMTLITGAGQTVGSFVIAEIGQSIQHTDPSGRIIACRVGVNLIEHYAEDLVSVAVKAAKAVAFAVSGNNPVEVPFVAQSQGLANTTMKSFNSAVASAGSAEVALRNAQINPATADANLRQAGSDLDKCKKALEDFEVKASKVQAYINNYTTLQANLESTLTYASNAIAEVAAGDVDGALDGTRQLQSGLGTLGGSASNIAVLSAIRRI